MGALGYLFSLGIIVFWRRFGVAVSVLTSLLAFSSNVMCLARIAYMSQPKVVGHIEVVETFLHCFREYDRVVVHWLEQRWVFDVPASFDTLILLLDWLSGRIDWNHGFIDYLKRLRARCIFQSEWYLCDSLSAIRLIPIEH